MVRQSRRHAALIVCALAALALPTRALADDAPRKLVVGTKPSPPFAMQEDGAWTGLSVELWARVADAMHVTYEIKAFSDVPSLLAAVQAKQVDLAVGALTITAEREKQMDFSHPFYSTGLAIATAPGGSGGGLSHVLRGLLTWDFAKLLAGLVGLLGVIGALVWLVERRRNDAQFAKPALRGIADGVWWSAVTMTTVGYGDKSPVTFAGRLLGLAWMFSAIIIISIFTASITSTLTVDRLESAIHGPEDLVRVHTGTVAGSTSAAYLDAHHIAFTAVPTVEAGLQAVATGKLDAMVYDAPILQYTAKSLGGAVVVLPNVFARQDYGFAMPDGSSLREELNRALLVELAGERWRALLERYLGKE